MKINLKYHLQHTDYSCGPSCLKMVFDHLGKDYSEEKLISLCHTSKKTGTSHEHLIDEIKKEGFEYYIKTKGRLQDLIESIESGYLAIINYLDPFSKEGHYAVVTGYTNDRTEIILADPCNGNDYTIPWTVLRKMWHNEHHTSQGWYVIVGRESINL